MGDTPDPAHLQRARVIAQAFARTADHHRRTALIAGVVALAACGLAFAAGRPAAKGVALAIAILFAVACYRSSRSANNFIDPSASPVLAAIATQPGAISSVVFLAARSVVQVATESATLEVRVDDETPVEPLLSALSDHAPDVTVERQ